MHDGYHNVVADHYEAGAEEYEMRSCNNHVLEGLRDAFREVTMEQSPKRMLEIGYGPGVDMMWFADQNGVEQVHGIDLTPTFERIVRDKAATRGDGKVQPLKGAADQAVELLGEAAVDTVYVYFGALNTTEDLDRAAQAIHDVLAPGGKAVLTFVNKWYAFEILWNLVTFRPRKAMARVRKVWTGYSPTKHLASHCPSSREVRKAFGKRLTLRRRQGYCIVHPAWYRHHWGPEGSRRSRAFHTIDRWLRWTPFWNLGEHSLYVYEREATTA